MYEVLDLLKQNFNRCKFFIQCPFILFTLCNQRKMQINLFNEVMIAPGIEARPNVDWPWIVSPVLCAEWDGVYGRLTWLELSSGRTGSGQNSVSSVGYNIMQLCPRLARAAERGAGPGEVNTCPRNPNPAHLLQLLHTNGRYIRLLQMDTTFL